MLRMLSEPAALAIVVPLLLAPFGVAIQKPSAMEWLRPLYAWCLSAALAGYFIFALGFWHGSRSGSDEAQSFASELLNGIGALAVIVVGYLIALEVLHAQAKKNAGFRDK